MKTKKRYLLVLVFVFLFYAFLNVQNTFSIYRDTYSTTIKLTIEDPSCSITYETNGGTPITQATVTCGSTIGTIPETIKADNELEGWYSDVDLNNAVTSETVVNSNITIYAGWIPEGKVARVGNTYFNSLQLAVESVTEPDTKTVVTLLKNTTEHVVIEEHQFIEFDLKDHTFDNTGLSPIYNNGTMIIKNGTIKSSGTESCINNYGTAYITGGTIRNTKSKQAIYNDGGTITISGGHLSNVAGDRAAVHNLNNGTMTILGGTIVSENYHGVYNVSGTLVIGADDEEISTTTPDISGKRNGVNSVVNFEFYDGIIKGIDESFNDNNKAVLRDTDKLRHDVDGNYKTAYLEYFDNTHYTITFDANGGTTTEPTRVVDNGDEIGSFPDASNGDKIFVGWFTDPTGGDKATTDIVILNDVTYYAHYKDTICKRATTLHASSTITYGSYQTGNTIAVGNAFDCDVNGDDVFDPDTERFYYLGTDSNGNAILIFYTNTNKDNNYLPACDTPNIKYSTTNVNNLGPTTAYVHLPPTTLWTTVSLANDGVRQIYSKTGTTSTNAGTIAQFTYKNRAARFVTTQELEAACGLTFNNSGKTDLPEVCKFLFENIGPACPGVNNVNTYWTETPVTGSKDTAFRVMSQTTTEYVITTVHVSNNNSGIRPVIEVPLGGIKLESDEEPNNTNGTSGSVSQIDEETPVEGNVVNDTMTVAPQVVEPVINNDNISTEPPVPEEPTEEILSTAPVVDEEEPGEVISCEKPRMYDTGVRGEIKVYKYNTDSNEKGEEATDLTINDGYVSNLDPELVYYFESVEDPSINGIFKDSDIE